ncbi:DMT family transporter [Tropicimonas sp. TH_r6]|uniref:DMT family transporter n=1 Tax=Tropicimonas sp. TH_r6 TaxID=3082085 RepID=UPI00295337E2|nr:DMT family transporter [Tropicimonas sp. TH_r6]MDV7143671.1 DMT family transporter [Tropicimonas sp. TH_r6]
MSPNLRGALFMAAGVCSFTTNDAFMKSLSDDMSMYQAIFLRGILGTVLLVIVAAQMGQLKFRMSRRDGWMVLLRTAGEIAAAFFFISALFHMPMANASAIMQALPLTVTLAGAVFLGEAVGWRRLSAILVGFVGVMLIIRPGAEGFTIYSLYVVAAVLSVTVRDIAARAVSAQTSSMMVAVAASVGVWLFGAVGLIGGTWQPVSPSGWVSLTGAALMLNLAYIFSTLAMRVGDIAFAAPFRYTSLLWAMLLGFLVFGDWPDAVTLLGAAIVVATGIFTFHRERKLADTAAE